MAAVVVVGFLVVLSAQNSNEPPAAVDLAKLERNIGQVSEAVGGVKFDVECPATVPVERSYTFECSVTSVDRSVAFTVVVIETDSVGSVDWNFPPGLTDAELGYTGNGATTSGGQPAKPSQPGVAASTTFVMPAVVGMVLQDAQNLMQASGSYLMDQVDATGQGRFQVLDSNWKVCAQSPSPGTTVSTDQIITLSAVKLDESC